jgi:transposase
MIGERTPMTLHIEIARLRADGMGKKKIARTLGIGVETVRGICKEQEVSKTDERADPATLAKLSSNSWTERIPWSTLETELSRPYTTVKALWQEWAPEVSYLTFWRQLSSRIEADPATKARIRFHYQPGERFEMDYCDGLRITDRKSGKSRKTNLFACVSAASDYIYAEFVDTQRSDDFISCQNRCFAYYGGVPKSVIIDNLKSGVKSAHRYDPEVNPKYFEYSKHMGFVVIPARPRTPTDKPAIETSIGVIQRQFFAKFRDQIFYSLPELNTEFRKYLEELNVSKMKESGLSRAERFLDEKPSLKPLPEFPFENAIYKRAKVHNDCHIQVQSNFYSLPYRYIGQDVRVKITDKLIEAFSNSTHESLAVHVRLKKRGEYSTHPEHYPSKKMVDQRLDILSIRKRAQVEGGKFEEVIEALLSSSEPLRFFRRIQGLIRLVSKYPKASLEFACGNALVFNRLDYRFIEGSAHRHSVIGSGTEVNAASTPVREPGCIYLHRTKLDEAAKGPINE